MQYRLLGPTGIDVSVIGFGAGPVSTLMVGDDHTRQCEVVSYAIQKGINWFDTAATYGNGVSEQNLGRVLEELNVNDHVHVATKVRLTQNDLADIRGAVCRSVDGSLNRLRRSRITLLQLHNSITQQHGDEPTSITPKDVLGPGGVADTFEELRQEGVIGHYGMTGIGASESLAEVVNTGRFETMQVPYHLLNPSSGQKMTDDFAETNLGNIIRVCRAKSMGVFAIRVLAGGALAGNEPSPHTLKTPFFPIDLYERDRQRAAAMRARLGTNQSIAREAIRFAISHPLIHSALIGLAATAEIDEAVTAISSF